MNENNLILGQVCGSIGITEEMRQNYKFSIFAQECLDKHKSMNWGDVCDDDKLSNDDAILNGGRILSSYKIPDEIYYGDDIKIYIITESNREVTTILFPSEY